MSRYICISYVRKAAGNMWKGKNRRRLELHRREMCGVKDERMMPVYKGLNTVPVVKCEITGNASGVKQVRYKGLNSIKTLTMDVAMEYGKRGYGNTSLKVLEAGRER